MKEMAMSPTTGTPFSIGQGFLAGASAIGLGGLMFYGLGFSNEVGAAEKAMIWPVILLLILTTIHILVVYYLFAIHVLWIIHTYIGGSSLYRFDMYLASN